MGVLVTGPISQQISPKLETNNYGNYGRKRSVMKKIRGRLGIGSRNGGISPNNMPPLSFHNVHGDNVAIYHNGSVACRMDSYCKAIAFSDRPVKVNEKVCIRLVDVSTSWSGVLRIGFTSHDPTTLDSRLPCYACPDLTQQPGFWAKAFRDCFVSKDAVLFYYANAAGDVHFGINGEEKGMLFSGVDTRRPLWVMLDVYGNTTCVEFVDQHSHLNNSRASSTNLSSHYETEMESEMNQLLPSFHGLRLVEYSKEERGSQHHLINALSKSLSPQNQSAIQESPYNNTYELSPSSRSSSQLRKEHVNNSMEIECVLCYERPVDSVFYPCGHMCTCFKCSVKYWKIEDKEGCCPICRTLISDVIKTYKS